MEGEKVLASSEVIKASKIKLIIEIAACFILYKLIEFVLDNACGLLRIDGLWVGVLIYFLIVASIMFYVTKIEKRPLSSIGVKPIVIKDIPVGILISCIMFVVQQIPLLIIGIDYKIFAAPPNWIQIAMMSAYCLLCVGFGEEIMMRGFILHKSVTLLNNRLVAVIINCIIFYIFHWPPVRFVFGEIFNVSLNTIILCGYFFLSKRRSITPLIIAHGIYDILTAYLLPAFAYYIYG